MTTCRSIGEATDRVMAALMAGLEIEFGRGAGAALAHRFLEAEECDFHWDARIEERWLGLADIAEDAGLELDRVRILGRLDGNWFVAEMIVDGDGAAHAMMSRRGFGDRNAAARAFADG